MREEKPRTITAVAAPPGSGKTHSYSASLGEHAGAGEYAVVVVPTRALSSQGSEKTTAVTARRLGITLEEAREMVVSHVDLRDVMQRSGKPPNVVFTCLESVRNVIEALGGVTIGYVYVDEACSVLAAGSRETLSGKRKVGAGRQAATPGAEEAQCRLVGARYKAIGELFRHVPHIFLIDVHLDRQVILRYKAMATGRGARDTAGVRSYKFNSVARRFAFFLHGGAAGKGSEKTNRDRLHGVVKRLVECRGKSRRPSARQRTIVIAVDGSPGEIRELAAFVRGLGVPVRYTFSDSKYKPGDPELPHEKDEYVKPGVAAGRMGRNWCGQAGGVFIYNAVFLAGVDLAHEEAYTQVAYVSPRRLGHRATVQLVRRVRRLATRAVHVIVGRRAFGPSKLERAAESAADSYLYATSREYAQQQRGGSVYMNFYLGLVAAGGICLAPGGQLPAFFTNGVDSKRLEMHEVADPGFVVHGLPGAQ